VDASNSSLLQQLAEEHQAVRATMRWIEHELQSLRTAGSNRAAAQGLLELLHGFRHHLERHFALEESSEGAPMAGEDGGAAEERLLFLRREHGRLRESFDRLLGIFESAAHGGPDEFSIPEADLEALLSMLRLHEQAERSMFQRAALRDAQQS
jgi:hemerythrin-like domain-containing protein